MTLRCKPGDVAMIVAPYAYLPARGYFVTIVRAAAPMETLEGHSYGTLGAPSWVVSGHVPLHGAVRHTPSNRPRS